MSQRRHPWSHPTHFTCHKVPLRSHVSDTYLGYATKWLACPRASSCGASKLSEPSISKLSQDVMVHIFIYGDSLSWGIIPHSRRRLPFEVRWPGVFEMQMNALSR